MRNESRGESKGGYGTGEEDGSTNLSASEAEQLGRGDSHDDVEPDERNEDTKVSPAVVVADVQRGVELVSDAVRAELAGGGGVGVVDVSADATDVLGSVVTARLATGRVEDAVLAGLCEGERTLSESTQIEARWGRTYCKQSSNRACRRRSNR